MISKTFRTASVIVFVTLALTSGAWAACSNSSVSGTYGFQGNGADGSGLPTALLGQFTIDSSNLTFSGTETVSDDGVIAPNLPLTGTYSIASNCTGTGTIAVNGGKASDIYFVVTSVGLRTLYGKTGTTEASMATPQGTATCTNAGVKGAFGFEVGGIFFTGAPFVGPVALVGELSLTTNASGDGVINGLMSASEDGTIYTFTETPVTGSYSITSNCQGTASITLKGQSAMNYALVVVNAGKTIQAIETDPDTTASGTLQR
jgi:hypothetical protein